MTQKDRPDREKILDTIANRCHSNLDYPCDCQPHHREQCWGKVADQLLALLPDITKDELIVEMRREYEAKLTLKEEVVTKRVKKAERERMTKALRELHKQGWTLSDVIEAEDTMGKVDITTSEVV